MMGEIMAALVEAGLEASLWIDVAGTTKLHQMDENMQREGSNIGKCKKGRH
jgi:hypothetical protein